MSLTSLLSTQDQDALLGNDDSSTSDDDESSISDSESSSSDSEADESSSESEYEYDENEMSSDDESPTAPNEGEEGNQVTDDSFESNSSGNDGSSSDEPEPKRLSTSPTVDRVTSPTKNCLSKTIKGRMSTLSVNLCGLKVQTRVQILGLSRETILLPHTIVSINSPLIPIRLLSSKAALQPSLIS